MTPEEEAERLAFADLIERSSKESGDPLEAASYLARLHPHGETPPELFDATSNFYSIADEAEEAGGYVPAGLWHDSVREDRRAKRSQLVAWATPLLAESTSAFVAWRNPRRGPSVR
jgi:hypothetical protein